MIIRNLKIVALILIVLTVLTGCHRKEIKQAELDIKQHLETTYNRKFTIDKPKRNGNEGMGYSGYYVKAHPTDDPDLIFDVAWNKIESPKVLSDYLSQLWSKQALKENLEFMRTALGKNIVIDNYNFDVCGHDGVQYDVKKYVGMNY